MDLLLIYGGSKLLVILFFKSPDGFNLINPSPAWGIINIVIPNTGGCCIVQLKKTIIKRESTPSKICAAHSGAD